MMLFLKNPNPEEAMRTHKNVAINMISENRKQLIITARQRACLGLHGGQPALPLAMHLQI